MHASLRYRRIYASHRQQDELHVRYTGLWIVRFLIFPAQVRSLGTNRSNIRIRSFPVCKLYTALLCDCLLIQSSHKSPDQAAAGILPVSTPPRTIQAFPTTPTPPVMPDGEFCTPQASQIHANCEGPCVLKQILQKTIAYLLCLRERNRQAEYTCRSRANLPSRHEVVRKHEEHHK